MASLYLLSLIYHYKIIKLIENNIRINKYDQKLDYIITEKKII